MNRLACLAFGILVLVAGADAADLQAELAACIALQDKKAQLACFDGVTADRVTADRVTPDRVTPDRVTPDRVTPDRVTPDRVTPDPAETGGDTAPAVARTVAPAIEDNLQARLGSCMALPTKAAKLACFDRAALDGVAGDRAAQDGAALDGVAANNRTATAVSASASASPETLQARLADCIALSDKSAQMTCFEEIRGAEPGPGYSAARRNAETGEFEYRARLARVSDGRSFFMEDGQVWRALNPAPAPFRQGEFVIIRPAGGSFVMSQAGIDATAGVTRVR